VHHNEQSRGLAEPQEDEAVFRLGVVRIADQPSLIVIKHRLGFDKRYAVLATPSKVSLGLPNGPAFSLEPRGVVAPSFLRVRRGSSAATP
jgi:hypothetical protein